MISSDNIYYLNIFPDYISIKLFHAGTVKIPMIDIIKIEASKNYSVFHIIGHEPIISANNLIYQSKKINSKYFFRANKSCFINLFQLEIVSKTNPVTVLMTDKTQILISQRKKTHFLAMHQFFLYETSEKA